MALSPSDASCRAPRHPETRVASRNQDPFHRSRVNPTGFRSPKRLPSTKCSRRPAFAGASFYGNPPPIPRLCRRGSASGAVSHPRCSRMGKLDRPSITRALRPRSRLAARRLSTSATESTHEHDRNIDRTPRTERTVARPRSFFSWVATLSPNPYPFRGGSLERGQPRRHGSEALQKTFVPCGALPTAIACDGSFAPTQSARTPHCRKLVTTPAGVASTVGRPLFTSVLASLPANTTCAASAFRAAPRALPRRNARSANTRGAFHRRISP